MYSIQYRILILVICYLYVAFANVLDNHAEFEHILQHVRSTATPDVQAKAATEVIERTLNLDLASKFVISIDTDLQRNTFHLRKNNDQVSITASSGVSACKGFYHYLKYYCNCHVSWDGSQIDLLPTVLPDVDHQDTSLSQFMYYQNVCTWSYSFVWWTWQDWRKHIDWMALNGISLSLAPVQEQVWTEVYIELGLTLDEIDDHFTGPAFMAWQRMGNMRGWGGPLTEQFKHASSELQKQVIEAMRDLGIAVVLPAFAGHVPVAFARIFPNSTFTPAARWNSFSDQFCCPLYIDPVDPLFTRIGSLFMQKVVDTYGAQNHIYFSDPFNEMQPKLADAVYLASASHSIYTAMTSVDPSAVWLLQGWMFVENPFWTDSLMRAFLTAVPKGRMLVLDLQSEQNPQYQKTHSFYGQPFLWCMLHNFGGTLGMHGRMDVVNTRIVEARKMINSTMLGFGITPEGINQNYVMYEFALERGWDQTTVDTKKWVHQYVLARYGQAPVPAINAWDQLRTSVYSYAGDDTIRGKYVVCRRPGTKYTIMTWYNYTKIEHAWKNLLKTASDRNTTNDLLRHDLVDVTRQFLQNRIDQLYSNLIPALQSKNLESFRKSSLLFIDALRDMDKILGTHHSFLLGNWLESAKNLARSQAEAQLFEINARNQITLWGPTGQIVDYAMKQWAGLVADYCLPRWQMFFDMCEESLQNGKSININRFRERLFKEVENPFNVDDKRYPTEEQCDSVGVSKSLYAKWVEGFGEM